MISEKDLPAEVMVLDFHFPNGYSRIEELELTNLDPWYFVEPDRFSMLYTGIRERYPLLGIIVPFARRNDCDDVACFVVDNKNFNRGQVLRINLWPDGAVLEEFKSFWDWFRTAIEEMIEWSTDIDN